MGELLNISPILASILVMLMPFAAFVVQACLGKRSISGNIALIGILISTLLATTVVLPAVWNKPALQVTYNWFTIGTKTFTIGILLNNLTVLMQLIVCIIAVPVHIYSRAYMKGDPGIARYWMFLSLFCFAMLGLTISKNLLMLYVFWELVGFASYLLIGFWYTKDAAAAANKKAFIINRIGDIGFLIGLSCLYTLFGTLDITEILGEGGLLSQGLVDNNSRLMTLAGLGFFLGAMVKSAQFPLHIWLPDAMEGPTSVSSLIHAATMVAAGVFLLSTLFPLFNATVLLCIAIIGTITALMAAYFALEQNDIKKVLAYSTISQLGYMMVAVGIGAWDAAMFHLTTHAFFKCLLFLCAGAVIHEMSAIQKQGLPDMNPQDLRNMGGLRKYMPKTFVLMTIASLALAGFPLTSGFLSKDAIVISSFEWAIDKGGLYIIIPVILVLVSIFTAFYIGRLLFKTFFGKLRVEEESYTKLLHEAPKTMLWPMTFLAVGCLFFCFSVSPISYHLAPILDAFSVDYSFAEIHSLHIIIPIVLTTTALISWWIGYRWYVLDKHPIHRNSDSTEQRNNTLSVMDYIPYHLTNSLVLFSRWNYHFDKYVIDGTVNAVINFTLRTSKTASWIDTYIVDALVIGVGKLSKGLADIATWFDKYIVDGLVNTIARTTYYMGHLLRWVQNGRLQNYLGFALTMVLIGIIYLILR